VEGDLGMRWNAPGVLDAAAAEALSAHDRAGLERWVREVHERPGALPGDTDPAQTTREEGHDLELARLAAVAAARRHARPANPGEAPRPLQNVGHLIGSGGVLRHAPDGTAEELLRAVLADHGGGWRPPQDAVVSVDTAYLLFAAGLLGLERPSLARRVAEQVTCAS